jgi:hypothetical protein
MVSDTYLLIGEKKKLPESFMPRKSLGTIILKKSKA